MAKFQFDDPSLLKQRLDDLRDLRAKDIATKLPHNHKIRFTKLKELRNELSNIKSVKVQQKINVMNQLQMQINSIQNEGEEVKLETRKILKEVDKCKADIASAELSLVKTQERVCKAKSRLSDMKQAQKETDDELQRKWTALVKSYNYFKQRLQCVLQIEDPRDLSGILYLFSVVKTDDYYVRLTFRDGRWSFSELTPKLSQQTALAEKLAVTKDISGFLACLVKLFQEHKSKRQLKEKGK